MIVGGFFGLEIPRTNRSFPVEIDYLRWCFGGVSCFRDTYLVRFLISKQNLYLVVGVHVTDYLVAHVTLTHFIQVRSKISWIR